MYGPLGYHCFIDEGWIVQTWRKSSKLQKAEQVLSTDCKPVFGFYQPRFKITEVKYPKGGKNTGC